MNSGITSRTNVLKTTRKVFTLIFLIPILSVWTAGSGVCAIIASIAGILGAFGWKGIAMNLTPDYALPRIFSLPLGFGLALLLFISFVYTRRFLRSCLDYIKA